MFEESARLNVSIKVVEKREEIGMKKVLCVGIMMAASSCGLTARDSEAVGQIKHVIKKTPIFCPDETLLDMSLGLMRNGTGSVSQENVWIRVSTPEQEKQLRDAATSGAPVRVTYDVQRVRFCWEERETTRVELIK